MSDETQSAPDASQIERTLGLGESLAARVSRRSLTWGGLGALALVAILVMALRGGGDGVRYTTESARRGDLTVTVTATGTLQPTNQVDVSSELSGIVLTVSADYNDQVKKGQELARLDTTKLEAQVLQSSAAVESAQAKVKQSEATLAEAESQIARLQHVRELSGGKVPAQADLDTANAAVLRARADLADNKAAVVQAQATLSSQKTDLGKASIKSPINGLVLVRAVEPGQTVASSLQAPVLFTLAEDLTRMELHVSVDEADVGQVKEGQTATFGVDAWPDRRFDAKVQQVRYGAVTLEGVVTYETVLEVDNSERLLRPGMTATAEITVNQLAEALLVPNAALRFIPPARAEEPAGGGLLGALIPTRRWGARAPEKPNPKKAHVYVLEQGRPKAIEVVTGPSDGTWTQVKSGSVQPDSELLVDAATGKK
ncbi:MAG TPA: efflux RND transporter periplasmic adaptor subunit [Myxococcota bacterium]|nr:efflux RND transporter periplasmic adaptor subunit [Myxococcota bacterium]